jgi:uncharacterized RDD family membrane protein YckC
MKCPKCHYLGFDTGDRCRNCGYDFSLLAAPTQLSSSTVPRSVETLSPADEIPLHALPLDLDRLGDVPTTCPPEPWRGRGDQLALAGATLSTTSEPAGASRRADALPLFLDTADDRPLIKFPAAPRAPLAVRKTPDAPRARPPALSRRRPALDEEPQLDLSDEPAPVDTARETPRDRLRDRPRTTAPAAVTATAVEPCTPGARIGAAMLDLGMLLGVDLLVLYFTLRMAAMSFCEWQVLPLVPFAVFLLLVKLAYYWAFTAIGGQTIGKMAMRIRVIADEGVALDPATALRRTLLASTSVLTLGAAFLPALVRRDRRAVHDQIAHTRVVALPAA